MSATKAHVEPKTEEAAARLSARIDDSQRRVRPPVAPDTLAHRDLKGGEFWRSLPPFKDVEADEFLDYRFQMKKSINSHKKLFAVLEGWVDEEFLADAAEGFRRAPMAVRVTPYLLSLIDWDNPYEDPIRRQFIPVASSLLPDHPMLTLDSLHEQVDAPVPGLTHRYPDKALFLILDTCPVYCRFCTRSYAIGLDTDVVEKVKLKVDPKRWEQAFAYIESRPELEDIVISGGDAFNLAAKHIRHIGERLLSMPQIRRIRYATKGPAVIPMKVTSDEDWLGALTDVYEMGRKMHKQVALHTHFGTANEVTEVTRDAMNVLFERGIPVRNQTVLQRGVNDTPETMTRLTRSLGEVNVEPYYVYQHDMVKGVEDLRTSVQVNLDVAKYVRGVTAGFNTPTFVVDAPGGGGKREVASYEYYNRENGISIYTAPSVKPGQYFMYFDPLHSLSEDAQERWKDEAERDKMVDEAMTVARDTNGIH